MSDKRKARKDLKVVQKTQTLTMKSRLKQSRAGFLSVITVLAESLTGLCQKVYQSKSVPKTNPEYHHTAY